MTPRPEPRPRLSPQSPSRYALRPSRRQPRYCSPPDDQTTSTPTTTDAKWGHFKRPRWASANGRSDQVPHERNAT